MAEIITQAKEWAWLGEPERVHFLLTQSLQRPDTSVSELANAWKPRFYENPESHFQRIVKAETQLQANPIL
ncbi:hypothetical protein D3C85_1771740 [compost metagenome]